MILESVGKFHLNSVCGKTDLVNIIIIYSFSIRLPAWTRITAKGEGQTPRRRTGWYAKLPTIWEDRSRKEGVILKRRCLESVHVTSHAEENPILRELETILYAGWPVFLPKLCLQNYLYGARMIPSWLI